MCGNYNFKAYPLELIEVTGLSKDGPSMCRQFADMIDNAEKKFECTVVYFITDADGGSLKGRKLLAKERPWLFTPSCWAHQACLIALIGTPNANSSLVSITSR